ncbi:hypothetical protein ACIPLC_27745 [Kitasatospora sp. NPDC086801]|uniref:hypothetical protein n=1 Tax=Kitasatospora sp. NPDC086801 TaxID=3364066 RepID=UPI0038164688
MEITMKSLKAAAVLITGALAASAFSAPTAHAASPFPVTTEILPLVTLTGTNASVTFAYDCAASLKGIFISVSLTQPSGAAGGTFTTVYRCTGAPKAVAISAGHDVNTPAFTIGPGTASVKIAGLGYSATTVSSAVELI